jgi:hypothetical protein
MASIWDFLDSLPKRADVSPEELAARRQGYADLYQGGLLARNRDQMPLSVQGAQATQDFMPVIGDALALGEAGEALSRGEIVAAGLLGAGAAIGLVPGAGDALAKPVMAAGRRAADIARRIEVDPNALGSMGGNIRLRPQGAEDAPATGIRAYHGSPHSFDKFSMDAIGTGEGAQAYGHGLYFAEAEDTAKFYRDNYAKPDRSLFSTDTARQMAQDQLQAWAGDVSGGIEDLRKSLQGIETKTKFFGIDEADAIRMQDLKEAISYMEGGAPRGSMYEVNINANPEDFLDWDAPFSTADDLERFASRFDATNPELRKRLEDFGYMRQQMGQPMPDGNDIIREIMGGIGSADAARASSEMREAGIPGIRYRDASSRGIGGEPTRNYVVFDENLINIVKKYGIAGAAAMLGVSAMDVEQAMAQGAPQPQPQGLLGGAQ